ncbi:hypothetical protein ABID25_006526 [Mesorhizobium abyssinicae]
MSEVTTKRGLAPCVVHSALATIRRRRDQLNTRAAWSLFLDARRASCKAGAIFFSSCSLRVAGKAKDIVDAVGLAPGHQLLPGKAGIGAQDNAHSAPLPADLPHDPLDLLDRSLAGVDVGTPELCRQQVPAAEDVERQVAVAVAVAVEEPAFRVTVQRVIGGVEIDPRRRVVGSRNRSTNRASIACVSWPILW